MEPNEMLERLSVPFPPHAIKQREGGGGKMLSYVETETVIRFLNQMVGVWDFRITEIKVQPMGEAQLLIVWGEMTIPGLGTRAGTGVQIIHGRGGEDMWKGAASDCLKKCATTFGVGIDLYGPDLLATNAPANTPPRQQSTTRNTVPASQGGGVTEPQLKKIGAMRTELRMSPEYLRNLTGLESAKDLSKQKASELIDHLQELIEQQAQQVEVDPDTGEVIPAGVGSSLGPPPF